MVTDNLFEGKKSAIYLPNIDASQIYEVDLVLENIWTDTVNVFLLACTILGR